MTVKVSRKKQENLPARRAHGDPVTLSGNEVSADVRSDDPVAGDGTPQVLQSSHENADIGRETLVGAVVDAVAETFVKAIFGARDAAREAGLAAAMQTEANRRRTPVGVDGCKHGWLAVAGPIASCQVEVHERFESVLLRHPDALVVVDIPIGLVDSGDGRRVDKLMREKLGGRRATVFTAPSRAVLDATDYDDAKRRNLKATGKSLSRQTWALVPKIKEVDKLITPSLQEQVLEGHPEVAFAGLTGEPMPHSKTTPAGRLERARALRGEGYDPDRLKSCLPPGGAAKIDDLLDACALHDVARRFLDGTASALPDTEERDPKGILMQVWHAQQQN